MNPLLETAVDAEPALLQCRLAEDGYVFVRGLLNPGLVGEARALAVGCLEEAELASGADRPIWSGRAPRENELASDGPLVSAVAEDGVICRLAHSAELVGFLERLIGGEVFVWQDCAGRLRIMLGDHADDAGPLDRCGSPSARLRTRISTSSGRHSELFSLYKTICLNRVAAVITSVMRLPPGRSTLAGDPGAPVASLPPRPRRGAGPLAERPMMLRRPRPRTARRPPPGARATAAERRRGLGRLRAAPPGRSPTTSRQPASSRPAAPRNGRAPVEHPAPPRPGARPSCSRSGQPGQPPGIVQGHARVHHATEERSSSALQVAEAYN